MVLTLPSPSTCTIFPRWLSVIWKNPWSILSQLPLQLGHLLVIQSWQVEQVRKAILERQRFLERFSFSIICTKNKCVCVCLKVVLCKDVISKAMRPILQMRVRVVEWNENWNLVFEDIYELLSTLLLPCRETFLPKKMHVLKILTFNKYSVTCSWKLPIWSIIVHSSWYLLLSYIFNIVAWLVIMLFLKIFIYGVTEQWAFSLNRPTRKVT